jgi:hypothetical protein
MRSRFWWPVIVRNALREAGLSLRRDVVRDQAQAKAGEGAWGKVERLSEG